MYFLASCPRSLLCILHFHISYMYINMHSCSFRPCMYKCRHKCSSGGEPPGVACRAKGRCRQSALWGGPFGDMPSPRVPLCRPCHAPGLLFRRCHDITQEPTKADCKASGVFHLSALHQLGGCTYSFIFMHDVCLKHLHNVETHSNCPQTFFQSDFQCRDDVSEVK